MTLGLPRSARRARRHARAALLALLLLALVTPAGPALAAVHPDEQYGESRRLETTGAEFWQWLVAQPVDANPLLDTTGEFCDVGQSGRTWFLAGALGTPVTRTCTIPRGVRVVLPVVNAVYAAESDDPPAERTEEFARAQVAGLREGASGLRVTVDGDELPSWRIRYEDSTVFSLRLPEDNIFGLPAGTVAEPAVDAGYYVRLRPLRPGTHTVRIQGAVESDTPGTFSVDVTYHLTVTRERFTDPGAGRSQ